MAMALHAVPPLVKVAVAQMTAISDTNANFITCARLVQVQSLSRLIPLLIAVAGFGLKRSSLKLLFPLEAIRSSFVLLTHWEGCVVLCCVFFFFSFFSLKARSLVLNVFVFFCDI